MLDGTQPLPTLSGGGDTQPMGLLDFGPGASPRYLVAFIFNLGPGQTWSTPEGFTPNAGPTTFQCYALNSSVVGNYCVGYDPARVTKYDTQLGSSDPGYSPNPTTFYTYAFTPESATPDNDLGYNDSIAAGSCEIQNFYFVTNKNNFGRDEVADQPDWPSAFYLFLEGYTPNAVGSSIPSLSGSFNSTNIPGLTYSSNPTKSYDIGDSGAAADVPQRIRFAYDVDFTSASLAAFPAPGAAPNTYTLQATISILGQPDAQTPEAEFYLLGGDDPYFTNLNSGSGVTDPQYYLSQDLRVFTGTPAVNNTPVAGSGAPTLGDSVSDAYTYIGKLIDWLNTNYGYLNTSYTPPDTNFTDPLDTLLPDQNGALNGDSSVTPKTGTNNNYSFAIARVRLRGSSGSSAAATGVKVFFRIFTTQTFDTNYINTAGATSGANPNVTYPSTGSLNNPQSPLPGTAGNGATINGCSLPFFASKNYVQGPTDYQTNGVNNQTIEIPAGQDYAWAFYGCFLNVNDASNTYGNLPAMLGGGPAPVQYWLSGSAHNCLVAQIAYSDAPIVNSNGVIESPENSDKLAQRNLQVTTSGNPGYPATHIVPETIDVCPSPPPQSSDPASILSYPDEMMIDWGTTPPGSVASLYWPGVSASAVLQLASELYPAQTLTAADANTIQLTVASPVTYIPIPTGAGGSFAGLITVQLPATVRYGNQFNVVVRRIATKQVVQPPAPPPNPIPQVNTGADAPKRLLWRYVAGTFLARISVQEESTILPADENLLAILKWRLGLIGTANRWYPVLQRYIGYLTGRIDNMGGNASQIPASPTGYQPALPAPGKPAHEHCFTGKVIAIRYDRFGDFEGFELLTEHGQEHRFRGHEYAVEEIVKEAWIERTLITVCVDPHHPEWPVSIVLRR